ncbi:hypothetical protein B0H19DRAFT_1077805 [Mycena capillaripes]|nr:hypothetical protein B0H19DRAFT_1077805 [Mycena capillaripes]
MPSSLSTLAVLVGVFIASTHAAATIAPSPDICCISGIACTAVDKLALINPVPLASLSPDAGCCCVAANPLACRTVCDDERIKAHCRSVMCEEWRRKTKFYEITGLILAQS